MSRAPSGRRSRAVAGAIASVLLLLVVGPAAAQDAALLADDTDRELIQAHCSACHSLRLVTNQRGDRATWQRLIRWMQATQNLWEFAPETERRILDYLERNYPPEAWTRRAPLPPHLLPHN